VTSVTRDKECQYMYKTARVTKGCVLGQDTERPTTEWNTSVENE